MGKERISSQEISDYTNINATQIRRDLSAFGSRQAGGRLQHRFAARRDPEDPPDAGPAQHRPRSAPAGWARRLRARRSSPSTGSTSPRSSTPTRKRSAGRSGTSLSVTTFGSPTRSARRNHRRRGGSSRRQRTACRGRPGRLGDQDHLQLLRGAARRAAGRCRAYVQPRCRAALRPLLLFDLASASCGSCSGTATCSAGPGRTSTHAPLRVNGATRVTTSSSSRRSDIRSRTTSAQPRSCGPTSTGRCRRSCSTDTRVSRHGCCRT